MSHVGNLNPSLGAGSRALGYFFKLAIGLCCAATAAAGIHPIASEETREFHIPAQSLSSAMLEFSRQSDIDLITPAELLRGRRSTAIGGRMLPSEALDRLLVGTGLRSAKVGDTLTIRLAAAYPEMGNHRQRNAQSETSVRRSDRRQAADSNGSGFPEIIVTARKREESVQDVPSAVTVLDSAQLKRIGADEFGDFSRTVPGLNLNQINAIQNNVNIRGISNTSMESSAQSTVAFYIDELPTLDAFLSWAQPDLRLFDVNRVEVLRGPQGTLFGSGALAGAIRILTNKPDLTRHELDFEAGLSQVEDGDLGYSLSAMANIPLLEDRFAVRAVGYRRGDPGYIDNVITGEPDQNGADAWGGRLMGRFKASDVLLFTGSILHQDTDVHDGPYSFRNSADGGPYQWSNYSPESGKTKFTIYNLVADYSLSGATLTSSSSYAQTAAAVSSDTGSRILTARLELPQVVAVPFVNFNESDALAEELRLVSNEDQLIDYVLGAFYMRRNYSGGQIFSSPIAGFEVFRAHVDHEVKEQALFGELIFALTGKVDLTVGGRAFWNDYVISSTSTGLLSGLPQGVVIRSSQPAEDHGFNPKAVLAYQYSDDTLLYALAARGYRTGFVNLAFGKLPLTPYSPDTLWNYELGYKSHLLNGKLLLNVAAYRLDWRNVQIEASRIIDGLNFIGIANAGQAFATGLEIEAAWQPTPKWEFTTALSLNDTKLTEIAPRFRVDAQQGSGLPAAPHFTISNSLQYAFDWCEWTNYLRIEHQYVGTSLSEFPVPPESSQPEPVPIGNYQTLNLRAGFDKNNLAMTLYATNLAGSEGITHVENRVKPDPADAVRMRPRVFGATVSLRF
jgi:iron complex outermembrane recepter protein